MSAPQLERTVDVLRRELQVKGWREEGPRKRRAIRRWRHEDGEQAMSLHDAIVKQLMREATE